MPFTCAKQKFLDERVDLLYKNSHAAQISSIFIACFVLLVFSQFFVVTNLYAWAGMIALVNAVRFYFSSAYLRADSAQINPTHWKHGFYLGLFVSGSLWGGLIWFLPDNSSQEIHYFVLLVLTGLAGGALSSYSASAQAYTWFVVPLLLPLAVHEILSDGILMQSVGLLIVLFVFLTIAIACRAQGSVEKYLDLCSSNAKLCNEVQRANNMMEDIFCSTHVLFANLDLEFNYLRVNRAFSEMDGRGYDQAYFVSKNHFDLYPNADTLRLFEQVRDSGETFHAEAKEFCFSTTEKSRWFWDWSLQAVKNSDGIVDSLILTLVDVSAHKRAEFAIQEKEVYINSIMETAMDCIVATDARGKIISVNSRVTHEFGYKREELVGKAVECLMPEGFRNQHEQVLKEHVDNHNNVLLGRRLVSTGERKNGETFPIEVAISDTNIQGVRYFVAVLRDVSETQELLRAIERSHQQIIDTNQKLEQRNKVLKELSSKDVLTGLFNRRYFNEYLLNEWRRACRQKSSMSIMMIDIDYFKQYNDAYGHQKGDECLNKVAVVLKELLHRPADLIARYGGEEFIVILPSTDTEGACVIAENMRISLEKLKIDHSQSAVSDYVTISIGVASTKPEKAGMHEKLINEADRRLYEAKNQGRNRVVCEVL